MSTAVVKGQNAIALTAEEKNVEKAILGACLLEQGTFQSIKALLIDADFYTIGYADIWRAMDTLAGKGSPIDLITVSAQLRSDASAVTAYELAQLTNYVNQVGNVQHHAYLLKQLSLRRALVAHTYDVLAEIGKGKDVMEVLDKATKSCTDMLAGLFRGQTVTTADVVDKVFNQLVDQMTNDTQVFGIMTGLHNFDAMVGGFKKGNLIVIAGRPGMGKTAWALNIVAHNCKQGKSAAVFSLEMTAEELVKRLLAGEGVNNTKIKNPKQFSGDDMELLQDSALTIKEWKLFIDTSSPSLNSVRAQAMRHRDAHGLDLVVIDYLQLMSIAGHTGNREAEISALSRGLKQLAKDLDVPIILLSQLSRKVEERPTRRPMLSDLRESGAIEQDADMVIFPFRPEYYGFTEDESGNSLLGVAEMDIAKFRDGEIGTATVGWEGKHFRFIN